MRTLKRMCLAIDMPASGTVQKTTGVKIHKVVFVVLLVLFLVGGGVAGYLWGPWKAPKKPSKNIAASASVKAGPELRSSVSVTLSKDKEVEIPVSVSTHAMIVLTVPKGAVKENTRISIVPYVSTDKANPLAVRIFPETVVFQKPVSVLFDLTHTAMSMSGPRDPAGASRTTGTTAVYRTSKTDVDPVPFLIARNLETGKMLTARISRGGIYSVMVDDKNQVEVAKKAIDSGKAGKLTLLESGSTLVGAKSAVSAAQKSKLEKVTTSILADKTSSIQEYLPAMQLKRALAKLTQNPLVEKVYADDVIRDYLRSRCGETGLNEYEYWTLADTAKEDGATDIEETCRNNAKRIVRAETDKLLASGEVDVMKLVIQYQKCAQFKFTDSYLEKIQEKVNEAAAKEAQKTLEEAAKKDPKTREDLEKAIDDLKQAIAKAQATSDVDQNVIDQMVAKMGTWAYERAKMIINDPNSSPDDAINASAEAMARGASDAQAAELGEMTKGRLSRTPQEVANSPGSSWGEVAAAMQNENLDAETKEKLRAKLQDFRKKKVEEEKKKWITPTPIPTLGEIEPSVDMGVIGPVMLQGLFGLESYTEGGINNLADQLQAYSDEQLGYSKQLCDAVDDMVRELGTGDMPAEAMADYRKTCADVRGGAAKAEADGYINEIRIDASEIGRNQENYENDAQKEDPDHARIEFTPTPEPTEPESDIGQQEYILTEPSDAPTDVSGDAAAGDSNGDGE